MKWLHALFKDFSKDSLVVEMLPDMVV